VSAVLRQLAKSAVGEWCGHSWAVTVAGSRPTPTAEGP
jgi:hypothetical protein